MDQNYLNVKQSSVILHCKYLDSKNCFKMDKRSCKLILAATGSVAALKIPLLIKTLLELPEDEMTYVFEVTLTLDLIYVIYLENVYKCATVFVDPPCSDRACETFLQDVGFARQCEGVRWQSGVEGLEVARWPCAAHRAGQDGRSHADSAFRC